APLVVLWFGFGLGPKIALVALVTFFPMLVALVDGYEATEPEIEQLLATMGASRATIFRRARLPSALPFFFAGLRISITYAVVAAIFAEYAGAARGLGIYILNAKNNFRPDLVLAAVFVSAALTLVLFATTVLLQHLSMPWRQVEEQRP
ncbi:MAG: ABC transporter permease, partial [Paracoccus sp. (in: a-proteobacteria)]